jgi:hypothetical protein
MKLRVSRALLAYLLAAAFAGLASAWRIFSSPSEVHAQVAFGLSSVRLILALLLLAATACLSLAGWTVWRNPFRRRRTAHHLGPVGARCGLLLSETLLTPLGPTGMAQLI